MDILNFISWIKGGRVVKTVDPTQTLLPVGLKDNRRDDGYLAGAISVQDLVDQIIPTPTYKVYTALLTQSGTEEIFYIYSGEFLTIGVTYWINDVQVGMDFTNVGAPNNNFGTYFVATGTTPNSWGIDIGTGILGYNTGAPVVTVLENTIGNIWFTYGSVGVYYMSSDNLFIYNKTVCFIGSTGDDPTAPSYGYLRGDANDLKYILTQDSSNVDYNGVLHNTPIEIRVYN